MLTGILANLSSLLIFGLPYLTKYSLYPSLHSPRAIWLTWTRISIRLISAQDYALVLGMPGTGKTTVIAALIKAFVAMGKTVLLTSYTHSAVDTILLKLDDADFTILRVGNVDKVSFLESMNTRNSLVWKGTSGRPQIHIGKSKTGYHGWAARASSLCPRPS